MMMVIPVPTSLACSLQGAITSSWSFQLIFFGPDMMVPTYPQQWLWIAMKDETWMILSNLLIVIPYGLNSENQLFRDSVEWKCCRISHNVWLESWIHEVSSLFPASLHLTWGIFGSDHFGHAQAGQKSGLKAERRSNQWCRILQPR